MYDWSPNEPCQPYLSSCVSVVVERMYDWSFIRLDHKNTRFRFQLLLKGCTIEARTAVRFDVPKHCFSCCWKDVRLKLLLYPWIRMQQKFQLLLKGCTIEALFFFLDFLKNYVSVVVERMYDWSAFFLSRLPEELCFSCCWKDVRLKLLQYVRYV